MNPHYKITISPLCDDVVIDYFDAIASAIRLYEKAVVFLDMRGDKPIRFIAMNTPYSVLMDEKSGGENADYTSVGRMLCHMKDVNQIKRVIVDSMTSSIALKLNTSGLTIESLQSLSLDKEFSLDTLSWSDYKFIEHIVMTDDNKSEYKLPNITIHTIDILDDNSIVIDGVYVELPDIEKHIKNIERKSLDEEDTSEITYLNELCLLFGASVVDDFYCYFNPDAKYAEYSGYKMRLVEWFFELTYTDLANYSGNNNIVCSLLSMINNNLIILPKDYFDSRNN